MENLVSLILLTYNNLAYTKEAIKSIAKYTNPKYELIIVDNNSTDGTHEYLTDLPFAKCILNTENKGYPGGCNAGISAANGSFLCFLNNDIIVTGGWLENLLKYFQADEKLGIVGPLSSNIHGMQLDRNFKYRIELNNKFDMRTIQEYAEGLRMENYGQLIYFQRVIGHVVVKRAVIDSIGGFDERFIPGNYEDDDFCLRTKLAGFRAAIAQDVFIHHFGQKGFFIDGRQKYIDLLETNGKKFIEKWGIPAEMAAQGIMPTKKPEIFIPYKQTKLEDIK